MAKKQQQFMTAAGIDEPFPSSPVRPPRYGIYYTLTTPTGIERLGYENFYGLYAAHHFVNVILQKRPVKWIDPRTMTIDCDDLGVIELRASSKCTLEEIIEYEPSKLEDQWVTPEPYRTKWRVLALIESQHDDSIRSFTESENDTPAPAPKEKKPRKERKPRASREGLTSLADICTELGTEPRVARGILRKAKVDKPDAGWAWSSDDADAIAAITDAIKKGLK